MRAHRRVPLLRSLTLALLLAAVTGTIMAQTPPVPPVAAVKPKVDRVHGDERTDNYSWLREKTNPEVIAYLEAEDAYAESRLAHTKGLQEKLYGEILGRIKQTDLSVPYRKDGWWYFSRTEEGKQYPFYLRKKGSMEGPEELLLDVNALAEGKRFMGVGATSVSPDGNLLAYSTDSTGFRVYNLQVKDLRTGAMWRRYGSSRVRSGPRASSRSICRSGGTASRSGSTRAPRGAGRVTSPSRHG